MYLNISPVALTARYDIQEGTFGTAPVAIKYIRMQWLNLHNGNSNDDDDDDDSKTRVQEFDILCRLHHPRCVSFYGISHDAESILLVQVLCACLFVFVFVFAFVFVFVFVFVFDFVFVSLFCLLLCGF